MRPQWPRCPDCPSRKLPADKQKFVVPGDGPSDARVMLVGEAPGREENNRHRPFVGKTGEEMNATYLPMAGLSRDEVYFTNSCKCHWADSSDAPPPELVRSCAEFHLRRELAEIQPQIVVLMGGTANKLVGKDVDYEHGFMAYKQKLLGHKCDLYSTYHPALGMHKSDSMLSLIEDFKRLKLYMRGEISPLVNEWPEPEYERLVEPRLIRSVLAGRYDEPVAVDTESEKKWLGYRSTIRYVPWCATVCVEPGYAFMVRVCDQAAWSELTQHLRRFRKVIMQNAGHDMEVLRMTGCELNWDCIADTMRLAYLDGRMMKGLKVMSRRLLGVNMRTFEDVVVPYGVERALDYLAEAVLHKWPKPEQVGTGEFVWRNCKECGGKGSYSLGRGGNKRTYKCECKKGKERVEKFTRKQGMSEKLNRLVIDMQRNPETDVWERWMNWEQAVEPLVTKLGPMPLASIEYVPEDEAIQYACGDAHETRRLYPILARRVAEIRRAVRG